MSHASSWSSLARFRSVTAGAVVATLALAGVAVAATTAAAHTDLRASLPAADSTVETLHEVRVEFSGNLLELGTELSVVDSTGAEQVLEPQFPSANAVTGIVDPDAVAAGATELRWRVVAEDGHPIEGVVPFTFAPTGREDVSAEPTAVPSEAPTPTTAPTPGATAAPTEPAASATPAVTSGDVAVGEDVAGDDAESVPVWVWFAIAFAALAGAGIALFASRGRRS